MSEDTDDFEYAELSESGSDEINISDSDIESDSSSDGGDLSSVRTWCKLSVHQANAPPPRFPFLAISGSTFNTTNEFDVLEYFKRFFDDDLLDIIVTETNKYAEQELNKSSGYKSNVWLSVTQNDIVVFLAINILQGIVKKPDERMYWSLNEILSTPCFPKLMSLRRYMQIKRYLHFTSNDDYDPRTHPNPKLNKIWPIYQNLHEKCSNLYVPERDISVDESLMLYKGRLGWKQYLPLKRARFGIKLYLLCESKSGYVYSFLIYTGKGTILSDKYKNMSLTSQVVLSLADNLLDQGYCITTDNFYTSPELADYLISHKTDIYGTMRVHRKEVPSEIQKSKLKKGEIIAFQRGKVMVMKWRDKKDICLLSTVHNTEKVRTDKTDKDGNNIMKPKLVVDYNDTMGGVDRLDQHLHDYPVTRKRGKKYYKKIFFHLLDISLYNAFVLYQKDGGKKDNLDFRLTLVERLIEAYHCESRTTKLGRPKKPGPLRLTERHFPDFIPPTEKKRLHQLDVVLFVATNGRKREEEEERNTILLSAM